MTTQTTYSWLFALDGATTAEPAPVEFDTPEAAIESFLVWYAETMDGDPSERQAIGEGMAHAWETRNSTYPFACYRHDRSGPFEGNEGFFVMVREHPAL